MKKVRALCMWLVLLTKRLFKKPAFLAILILIPLVVFAYGLTAQEDSGMLTIVLSAQSPEDDLSQLLISELKESSNIIRFVCEEDPKTAEEMVYNGAADAAWILSPDLSKEIDAFVSGHYTGKGFVCVIVREETVPLLLANEKLSGKLFARCAKTYFVDHLRTEETALSELSDSQIEEYFDRVPFEEQLFSYAYVDDTKVNSKAMNYLLMPVRGILSILVLIGAMAAAMFYISDEQEGLFSWVNFKKKPFVELGCQTIAVGNVMLFTLISIFISELYVDIFRELLCAILYVLCCAAFGLLLRILCRKQQVIGMVMPILTMAMLVICPVFISLPGLKIVQLLFPPTYYLNAVYNSAYMVYMLFYTAVLWIMYRLAVKYFKL